jgi:hypothetical protein
LPSKDSLELARGPLLVTYTSGMSTDEYSIVEDCTQPAASRLSNVVVFPGVGHFHTPPRWCDFIDAARDLTWLTIHGLA